MARALGGALRARFARRLEDVLTGLVVHVADAIDRAEFDTVTAVPRLGRATQSGAYPGG